MMRIFNRTDKVGLIANVAGAVALVLALNGLIFGLGWDAGSSTSSTISVPGPLVGGVWVLLFGGMATARWLLLRSHSRHVQQYTWLVVALIVFCAVYPFYTLAPDSKLGGLIGNLLTIGLALFVAWRVRKASVVSASLVGLVVLWVSFATLTIVLT